VSNEVAPMDLIHISRLTCDFNRERAQLICQSRLLAKALSNLDVAKYKICLSVPYTFWEKHLTQTFFCEP